MCRMASQSRAPPDLSVHTAVPPQTACGTAPPLQAMQRHRHAVVCADATDTAGRWPMAIIADDQERLLAAVLVPLAACTLYMAHGAARVCAPCVRAGGRRSPGRGGDGGRRPRHARAGAGRKLAGAGQEQRGHLLCRQPRRAGKGGAHMGTLHAGGASRYVRAAVETPTAGRTPQGAQQPAYQGWWTPGLTKDVFFVATAFAR